MFIVDDISQAAKQALYFHAHISFEYERENRWRVDYDTPPPFKFGEYVFVLVDGTLYLKSEFPGIRVTRIQNYIAFIEKEIHRMDIESDISPQKKRSLQLALETFKSFLP